MPVYAKLASIMHDCLKAARMLSRSARGSLHSLLIQALLIQALLIQALLILGLASIPVGVILAPNAALSAELLPDTTATEPASHLRALLGRLLSMDLSGIPIESEELKGLFCLGAGGVAGAATILFSGTAAAVAGAAQATLVAIPALAAAMWAGCAFGSAAAPGIVWLVQQGRPF